MEYYISLFFTRLLISAVFAGLVTAVFVFLLNLIVMPMTRIKGIPKAKREGRGVEARLVKILIPQGEAQYGQSQNYTFSNTAMVASSTPTMGNS